MSKNNSFTKLNDVMDTLFGENGCPWEKAQTHQSIRADLLEESYEVAEAIDTSDMSSLKEELGDLLLQVILHSRIAEANGDFCLDDVMNQLSKKLISRHSHIFGEDTAKTPKDALQSWEANKMQEKAILTPLENMQAVPKALPALTRAQKVIKRSNNNFAKNFSEKEALSEIRILLENMGKNDLIEDEMGIYGNVLFLLAQILTKKQINAEFVLTNAVQTFINSFM